MFWVSWGPKVYEHCILPFFPYWVISVERNGLTRTTTRKYYDLLNERLTSKPTNFIALLLRAVYDGTILLWDLGASNLNSRLLAAWWFLDLFIGMGGHLRMRSLLSCLAIVYQLFSLVLVHVNILLPNRVHVLHKILICSININNFFWITGFWGGF